MRRRPGCRSATISELYARKDVDAVIVASHQTFSMPCTESKPCRPPLRCFAWKNPPPTPWKTRAPSATRSTNRKSSRRRPAPQHAQLSKSLRISSRENSVTSWPVEMTWNVNQPGRWRPSRSRALAERTRHRLEALPPSTVPTSPSMPASISSSVSSWPSSRNSRSMAGASDRHRALVHRLSSPPQRGCQWRHATWKDGRKNWDTMTAVFDYGPLDDPTKGFQVVLPRG